MIAEKPGATTAARQHGGSQIDRVENQVSDLKADMVLVDEIRLQLLMGFRFESRAMIAGVAHIFRQLVLGERVAHDMAALG